MYTTPQEVGVDSDEETLTVSATVAECSDCKFDLTRVGRVFVGHSWMDIYECPCCGSATRMWWGKAIIATVVTNWRGSQVEGELRERIIEQYVTTEEMNVDDLERSLDQLYGL